MIDRRRIVRGAVGLGAACFLPTSVALAQNAVIDAELRLVLSVILPPQPPIGSTLLDRTVKVIRDRAEMIPGVVVVAETNDENQIIVQLSGVRDVDSTIDTITSRGWVELVDTAGLFPETGTIVRTSGSGTPWPKADGTPVGAPPEPIFETIVDAEDIVEVFTSRDQFDQVVIGFRLSARSSAVFEEFTRGNIGQPLAIVLDNVVINTPVIMAAISDEGQIHGLDDVAAESLAIQLSLAPLPARVVIEAIETKS